MGGVDPQLRGAMVSMALAGQDATVIQRIRTRYPQFRYYAPADACPVVTRAMSPPDRPVPRLLLLDTLVRLAREPAANLLSLGEPLTQLLETLAVPDGGGPDMPPDNVADLAKNALQASAAGVEADAWPAFAAAMALPMHLQPREVHKPICNDTNDQAKNGLSAINVTVTFETDLTLDELRNGYADPANWASCNAYLSAAEKSRWRSTVPTDKKWVGTFLETLNLFEEPWVTPLQFEFIQEGGDLQANYHLLEATPYLLVDEGYIKAQSGKGGQYDVHVEAKKVLRLTDPILQGISSLLCFTAWMNLCIAMAEDCASP
jgi:hypothetical protein